MAEFVLTPVQHAALIDLGEADIRRVISSTSPKLGLGRLVPRWHRPQRDPDPDPATADEWFTAHPDHLVDADVVLPKLLERMVWATAPANVAKVRPIVADMRAERAKPDMPELADVELKRRLELAGGDVTDPRPDRAPMLPARAEQAGRKTTP